MLLCDSHTHSSCSFDAENTVEQMCITAIEKGLYSLAITDHCEVWAIDDVDPEFGDFKEKIPSSFEQCEACKQKYKSKIKLLSGIELGEPLHDLMLSKKALSFGEFDFVLASVHNLQGEDDFFFLEYTQQNVYEILEKYFKEVLATANYQDFDSLAHLTYPLRYISERADFKIELSRFYPIIDEIFRALIKNNKALEINSSGLRKKIGCTLPDSDLIKRYKDLGGKYITIGSDAHNTTDLGANLEDACIIAKQCGFTHQTIFEKRIPFLIEL